MTEHLCECGCGETPGPGKRFVFTHHARTQRVGPPPTRALCGCGCGEFATAGKTYLHGHHARTRRRAPLPPGKPCECGCGQIAGPGKRFVHRHAARASRGTSKRPDTTTCLRCEQTVSVRQDGTLGLHWVTRGKVGERLRCPAGGVPLPFRRPRRGRRVKVVVDVMLPEGWDVIRFRAEARQLLRDGLDEPHVLGVALDEEAS